MVQLWIWLMILWKMVGGGSNAPKLHDNYFEKINIKILFIYLFFPLVLTSFVLFLRYQSTNVQQANSQPSLKENIILHLWLKRIAWFWANNARDTHFHTLLTCQLLIGFYWEFLFYFWSMKAWRYNNQLCRKEKIILHLWLKRIAQS